MESLTEHDRIVYDVIRKKQDMGIWRLDLKRETNLTDNMVKKSLKTLQVKELIKEVKNIQGKGRIHYMAAEFEPSKEITGGDWYLDGNLDTELIKLLKDRCVKIISKLRVTTLDGIVEIIRKNNLDFKTQQLEEILSLLILDNEIVEVKSNGMNEFSNIPVGNVCYKCSSTTKGVREPRIGAMASIPCGVCPRISECTPDGIISPVTCEYYKKWLSF